MKGIFRPVIVYIFAMNDVKTSKQLSKMTILPNNFPFTVQNI